MDIIQDVLIYQTQMMRNSNLGPYLAPDFSPPEHIVIVNGLFYASLGVMLLAAFVAMLIKSWVREFDRGLRAISHPEERAKTREFRYLGMERWKLPEMVGVLPLLIQISLLLFFIGLVMFLFHVSTPSFGVTIAIFGIGIFYYATTTSISVFVTSSPFHSPLSRTLATVYRRVHAYLCPEDFEFVSPDMDSTLATALGRIRRYIQNILHKSRPYLEEVFQYPIGGRTIDEVQLSTAASCLQTIHDSISNSQASGALQRSVWQVAGGPTFNTPALLTLPYWVRLKDHDPGHFLHLPPAMLVALVAVSSRGRNEYRVKDMTSARNALRRMEIYNVPWAQVVLAAFDYLNYGFWKPRDIERVRQTESILGDLTRRKELSGEESLWL